MASGTSGVLSPTAQESSAIESLDSAPEARFECPICLAWLRDPVVTSCGHRFCRNCILSWLERENACCPVDNMKLEKSDIFPDNFTRREISQQRTKCPNIVRGCLEELSPLDVESHLLACKFKPPEFHLPDNEKLRCMFVDVGCEEKFEDEPALRRHTVQMVHEHLMLVSRAYRYLVVSKHDSSSAASSAISQQANFWDPPSKTETEQSPAKSNDSMQNLIKSLYEKIVILEQKTREQEIMIANMSEQLSNNNLVISKMNQRLCNGSYIWYIQDFKNKIYTMSRTTNGMHYSPSFYTSYNGYKLCLRFNISPKDPSYMAILVHMMKSDNDSSLDWPFSGRITISIVHPRQAFRTIKETMMTRPELDAFKRPVQDLNPKGFGYTEFMLIEDILQHNYVENNQLIIRATVQPI